MLMLTAKSLVILMITIYSILNRINAEENLYFLIAPAFSKKQMAPHLASKI